MEKKKEQNEVGPDLKWLFSFMIHVNVLCRKLLCLLERNNVDCFTYKTWPVHDTSFALIFLYESPGKFEMSDRNHLRYNRLFKFYIKTLYNFFRILYNCDKKKCFELIRNWTLFWNNCFCSKLLLSNLNEVKSTLNFNCSYKNKESVNIGYYSICTCIFRSTLKITYLIYLQIRKLLNCSRLFDKCSYDAYVLLFFLKKCTPYLLNMVMALITKLLAVVRTLFLLCKKVCKVTRFFF